VSEGAHNIADSIDESGNNKVLLAPAVVIWSPFAFLISMVEAPGYSLRNAWTAEKPFSKEQFSLDKLDQ
jgi:hypothetical protein